MSVHAVMGNVAGLGETTIFFFQFLEILSDVGLDTPERLATKYKRDGGV